MQLYLSGVSESASDLMREAFEELETVGCSSTCISFYVDDSDNLHGSYSVTCDGNQLTYALGVSIAIWTAATAVDQYALAERYLAEDLNLKMCLLALSLTP